MSDVMPHPDPETLLRLVDDDLSPAESGAVREHLRICDGCRDHLESVQEALDDYERFHQQILKPSLPPPPSTWAPLTFPDSAKAGRQWGLVLPARFPLTPWLAAAAALLAVFILARRVEHPAEVRAAELLRKAVAAERASSPAPARQRIRIRSRSRIVVRAARLGGNASETADTSVLHAMFNAAGYRWDDPLSASAFAQWHDHLAAKQDQVDDRAGIHTVRTSVRTGVISDAALSLRSGDLHAVACTLRFRAGDEVIDMTELPDEAMSTVAVPSPASAPAPSAPAVPLPPANAEPGDELHVVAALHRIGADLGDPVEVERSRANVLVRVSGLDERRREQIRASLAGIPQAELRFEELRTGGAGSLPPATRGTTPAGRVNPLIADLQARLGSDVSVADLRDELIDGIDRAAERGFALRALARRFPLGTTASLSKADRDTLDGIVYDHTAALAVALQQIRRLLSPVLPNPGAQSAASGNRNWQQTAEGIPPAVDRLDRMVNGGAESTPAQLAETLSDLERMARP